MPLSHSRVDDPQPSYCPKIVIHNCLADKKQLSGAKGLRGEISLNGASFTMNLQEKDNSYVKISSWVLKCRLHKNI